MALTTFFLFACPPPDDENDGGAGGGTAGGSAGGTGGSTGGSAGGGTGGSTGGGTGGSEGGGTGGSGGGTAQRDLDIAVVKLTSAGALDTAFGDGGVVIIDHGQSTGATRDFAWQIDLDSAGRPVVFGLSTQPGNNNVDRFVTRLTATGELDPDFATGGTAWLDLGGTNDNARRGLVLEDGKILASGYTSLPTGANLTLADGGTSPQSVNHIVLLRLNSDGSRDDTFGDGGVTIDNMFPSTDGGPSGMAEAYVAVPQGNSYVTGGYGWLHPDTALDIDLVSFRWDNTGARDTTWATDGALVFNLLPGDGSQDRARDGIALPDDRVAFVGSAFSAAGNMDALIAVVGANGQFDSSAPSSGLDEDGFQTYSFDRAAEAFWSVAVNSNDTLLVAAGFREGATSSGTNDDAVLAIVPVTGGAADFAGAVPLSADSNDRFWGVAWQDDKIIAVGFIRDGTDSSVAIARFNADGTFDNTFGTDGVITYNLADGPGTEETARSVKVAADGSIFLVANIEH